jgi:hypothetical protein
MLLFLLVIPAKAESNVFAVNGFKVAGFPLSRE